MTKRAKNIPQTAVAADPVQWSEQSKHSAAVYFKREYVDEPYKCWRCGAACIFTAQDQKYTFEIKKASIDQRRKFCAACWSESLQLQAALSERDVRWVAEKPILRSNREFLNEWLGLHTRWKEFAPYKQDRAKINMLRRLLKLV
jgi:hypothetical protein